MSGNADETTAVALLRATMAGDGAGQAAILRSTDPADLLGAVAALAVGLGVKAFGSPDALDAALASWQQRRSRDL